MIDHIGLNVSDIARSRVFYAAALAPLGYAVSEDLGDAVGFGVQGHPNPFGDPGGDFWIGVGPLFVPRLHFAFSSESRDVVNACYAAALAAGGVDNGAPGLRPNYHQDYYAAFVLDPDGYNFEFVCHRPQA